MIDTYYLDESGSSGDLVRSDEAFDFARQPVFALACLGVDDPEALGHEIDRLKKLHKIQSAELKSTSIRNKPHFVADLIGYIKDQRLPVLVEVVEKRFQICATMVNHLVMPAVAPVDLEPGALWVRNVMAEYMRAHMPGHVMRAYIAACDDQSIESTNNAYRALLGWLSALEPIDEIAEAINTFAADTYEDFLALDKDSPESWRSGLPIPDESKNGKPFWMLPNLSCFTNIYARLNHRHGRNVGSLKLIHDEQLQFDEILQGAKVAVEGLAAQDSVPATRFADYRFAEQAHLEFVSSSGDSPGIQAADVIAGFTMRYVQDSLFGKERVPQVYSEIFQSMLELSDPAKALGFNFVTTTPDTIKLRVSPA